MNETRQLIAPAVRLDVDTMITPFTHALASLDSATTRILDSASIEPSLRELVRIRASQLNGCAYGVDTHTTDALRNGDTARRLVALAVWSESGAFTSRERAALAFTEVVTQAATARVSDRAVEDGRREFSEIELAALLALVVTINAWNMVGVTARPWPVDYETVET